MTIDFTRLAVLYRRLRSRQETRRDETLTGLTVGSGELDSLIEWPRPSREKAGHILCLASSGAGKTMLVANGLVQEMTKTDPSALSFFIIDPKGDLIAAVLQGLAAEAPDRLRSLRYLDPFSSGGFPFNLNRLSLGKTPMDIRAMQIAGLVAEVSTAQGAQKHLGVGARQLDVLQHVVLGALSADHPRANILWSLDALLLPRGFKMLASIASSTRAQQFLATAKLSDELRVSSAARLRQALAASDSLERLVAADSCIQFEDLLAPGCICFVDLGRPVGGMGSLQAFYANLLCRLAIEHLMERPSPWQGHHCRVVIDEAQLVAPALSDRAEAILTTGRSRGISLTLISQGTTLIQDASDTLLRVLLTNTPTKFVGRLAAADAELLGREQAPGQGIDETISAIRSRFVAAITNLRDREFFRLTPGTRERFTSVEVETARWNEAAEARGQDIAAAKTSLALGETTTRITLAEVAATGSRPSKPAASRPRKPRSRWG